MKNHEITRKENSAVEKSTVQTFTPYTDIVETASGLVVYSDMPGVREGSVDLTLEKNVLKITGTVAEIEEKGFRRSYSEYRSGNYERTFVLPEEVDRNKIRATLKHGVLAVHLPQAADQQPRKISVKVG